MFGVTVCACGLVGTHVGDLPAGAQSLHIGLIRAKKSLDTLLDDLVVELDYACAEKETKSCQPCEVTYNDHLALVQSYRLMLATMVSELKCLRLANPVRVLSGTSGATTPRHAAKYQNLI